MKPILLVEFFLMSVVTAVVPEPGIGQEDPVFRDGASRHWSTRDGTLVFPADIAPDRLENRHKSLSDLSQRRSRTANWPSLSALWRAFPGFVRVLFSLLLALLLAGLVYLFVTNRVWTWFERDKVLKEDEADAMTKIHELPFALEFPKAGLMDEADACRQRGDYSRAIIFLFSHVLVELEKGRVIRLHRGKTNRMYLHEMRSDNVLHNITEKIMLAFELVFFGHRTLSQEQFEACWSTLTDFANRIAYRKNALPEAGEREHSPSSIAESQ